MGVRGEATGLRKGRGVGRSALAAAAAAVPLTFGTVWGAGPNNYIGTSGNWSDGTKWSTAAPPNLFDAVTLTNNGATNVTVTLNVSPPTLNSVKIEGTNGGTVTLSQNLNGITINGDETVGVSGRGAVVLSGGTHSIINFNDLVFGLNAGANGSGTLSGTAGLSMSNMVVGKNGAGSFTQSGGTNTIGEELSLGNNGIGSGGGNGSYTLSGGKLLADFVGVGEATGTGVGTFTQTGGTNTVSAFVDIQNGTYTQSGGTSTLHEVLVGLQQTAGGATCTLSAGTMNVSFQFLVGGDANNGGGTGVFNMSGGTLSGGAGLQVADTPGTAVNFSAGSMSVGSIDTAGNPSLFNWTGGALTITGGNPKLTIGPAANIGPSITLDSAKSLATTGTVTIVPGGSLILSGGTSSASIVLNQGTFTYNSGNFAGKLVNQGTVNLNADFVPFNGIENDATLTVPLGRTVTSNVPFLNRGTLNLNGGTLTGSGGVVNDFGAVMNARGSIAPGFTDDAFVNNGTLNLTGLLTVSGVMLNQGSISIGAAENLQAAVSATNAGTITLAGGSVTGSGSLNNAAGGLISGSGSVSVALTNSGVIQATAGGLLTISSLNNSAGGELRIEDNGRLNVLSTLSSAGAINLKGANAIFAGPTFVNTGTIKGSGRVATTVQNGGVVRAEGGELDMAGSGNVNGVGGSIQAPAGGTVFYSQGLAVNGGGTIALSGGTFDNNNQQMLNSGNGNILGNGTFRSGGLTNSGTISFADSATSVLGPVTNNSGGKINITSNTTTFFGPVTNNAGGTIKTTSATARFLAPFTNNGVFSSDPADNFFANLSVGITGALVGGVGDRFFVTGDLINCSALAGAWDTRAAELHLSGSAAHVLATPGVDRGGAFAGYEGNFAWGLLELAAGESLTFADGDTVPGAALYVGDLVLDGGAAQVSLLRTSGADVTVYYDETRAANAYLGGQVYSLSGGGTLAPVPEPGGAVLVGCVPVVSLLRRRRRANRPCGPGRGC